MPIEPDTGSWLHESFIRSTSTDATEYSNIENVNVSNAVLSYVNETLRTRFYKRESVIFSGILFVFIILGNLAVLLSIALSKRRKSRTNFFIMHLALADICNGMVAVLTDVIWKSTVAWHAGVAACKVVRYFQSVTTFASNYVLVSLSLDRLDAVARPLHFPSAARRSRLLILTAWFLALLFSVPMPVVNIEKLVDGMPQCWINMSDLEWKVYITAVAVLIFVVPAFIIAACYVVIVKIVWSKDHDMRQFCLPHDNKNVSMSVTGGSEDDTRTLSVSRTSYRGKGRADRHEDIVNLNKYHVCSRGLIPRARVKTIKMTLVIVLAFLCGWSPYFVFDLLQVYKVIEINTASLVTVNVFIQSLASVHSAVNPVTFFLFNTRLCAQLRDRFCGWLHRLPCQCSFCRRTQESQPSSSTNRRPYVTPEDDVL